MNTIIRDSFLDELIKISALKVPMTKVAVTLDDLRKADRAHTGLHVRLPKRTASLRQFGPAFNVANPKNVTSSPEVRRRLRATFARAGIRPGVYTRGDVGSAMGNIINSTPSEKLQAWGMPKQRRLDPAGKEMINRAMFRHEVAEGKVKSKSPSGGLYGHRGLAPPLNDLNIAATATGPGAAGAARNLRGLRVPEIKAIEKAVPGAERLNLGKQRLSRHAIKRLDEAYIRNTAKAAPAVPPVGARVLGLRTKAIVPKKPGMLRTGLKFARRLLSR